MGSLVLAVFVASVLGSGHCAGMCGPFAAMTGLHPGPRRRPPRWRRLLGSPRTWGYQGGRLLIYVALGAAAGLSGAALDGVVGLVGMQQAATRLSGLAMMVWGALAVIRALGGGGRGLPAGTPGAGWGARLLARAGTRFGGGRARSGGAFVLGAAASLMPCGWLYAFVVTAAGTASAPWGAATMAAFWLGTVPALHVVALGARLLGPRLRRHLPLAGGLLVLAVGAFTVLVRAPIVVRPGAGAPGETCHHAGTGPDTVPGLATRAGRSRTP